MRKETMAAVALVAIAGTAGAAAAQAPVINEFVFNHTGSDTFEYVEVAGPTDADLSALTLLEIEGDGTGAGIIDMVLPLGKTNDDGLWTAGFFGNAIENGTVTLLLVEGFTGAAGNDLDSDNDGRLDSEPWSGIVDAVAVTDGGASDRSYAGAVVLTAGFDGGGFTPGAASRIPNGTDSDTIGDWVRNDFDLAGLPGQAGSFAAGEAANTPDAINSDADPGFVAPLPVSIPEIQGAGHVSPLRFAGVTTTGVVTAVPFGGGFYLQDAEGDGDVATSDAVFVTGGSAGIGQVLEVTGLVNEAIAGGATSGNLSATQIIPGQLTVLGDDAALPEPSVIGLGGRVPPNLDVIDPDEIDPPINLQDPVDAAGTTFNPEDDGIDFYESLESMRVRVEAPVAISATREFGSFSSEFFVLSNDGATAAPEGAVTSRGALLLQPDPDNRGDQNPERVQIQFDASDTTTGTLFPGSAPAVTVGDQLGDVTGVLGYSFGNFEVLATETFAVFPAGLQRETTRLRGGRRHVTVASYNVLNLSPLASDDNQRATLAAQIVGNLGSPDVIALQEIQDNDGTTGGTGSTVTDASETLQALADAVAAAGGPAYAFFDVAPEDDSGGGAPGGNIRNAFFYDPGRVELLSFESLTPDVLLDAGVSNPQAFAGTRNPLLAEFRFRGRSFTVINNHLSSRFGSSPIFGGPQPFLQAGEANREGQLRALNEFVQSLLWDNRRRRIVVLGDLNTFQFVDDLTEILPGEDRILVNLVPPVPEGEDDEEEDDDGDRRRRRRDDNVYTFNFEGNAQVLDHVFVTRNLARNARHDIVHVNVDFPRIDNTVGSDHEPAVVRLRLTGRRLIAERDEEDD